MKIRKPGQVPAFPGGPGLYAPNAPASQVAREKAIEKSRLAYFRLECGHLTNYEEQELLEAFRILETSLGPMWYACDTCFGKGLPGWSKKMPSKKTEYPDDPMF